MIGSTTGRERAIRERLYREPRWYACYTSARREKKVEALLRDRGFESYLPLVMRKRQWTDRQVIVPWPMFPSYVFARFALCDFHAILTTPGIATVVRTNGLPTPIPDEELDNVRQLAEVLARSEIEPVIRPLVKAGQRVRVTDGPFKGIRGIVVQVRGRRRVLVGLRAVGQALQVNIDTRYLQPLNDD
ncbi:MAG TPA: UpxY family transcription antiterminator [Longimicrobiales bacterium]|nr:UpxY family transcription antiterminator [Longimicrobiales bacterium]